MKTALRLTIQVGWAFLGLVSACAVISGVLQVLMHGWPLVGENWIQKISNFCFVLLALGILGLLIYGAWIALFRFSRSILDPTVFLVSLPLFAMAAYGNQHYFDPFVNDAIHSRHSSLLLSLLSLGILLVELAGWLKFMKVMPLVLSRTLFRPQLDSKIAS